MTRSSVGRKDTAGFFVGDSDCDGGDAAVTIFPPSRSRDGAMVNVSMLVGVSLSSAEVTVGEI